MTDLERELTRQIHELSKDVAAVRERVAVLESKNTPLHVVPSLFFDPCNPAQPLQMKSGGLANE